MEDFKDRFNKAVEASGKTRAQISRETGITESMLSYYATGRTVPRRGKLMMICENIGASPGYLLFGEEAVTNASEEKMMEIYNQLDVKWQKDLINYGSYLLLKQEEEHGKTD